MVELAISPDRGWLATTESLITATSAAGFSALGIAAVDYPKVMSSELRRLPLDQIIQHIADTTILYWR
jgi:hypothetical protein